MLALKIEDKKAIRDLKSLVAAIEDLREYWREVAVPIAESQFSALWGSRGYGQWSTSLYITGDLYRSYTQSGSRNNITLIQNQSFAYGSNVLYAKYHADKVIGTILNRQLLKRTYAQTLNRWILKKGGVKN